MSATPTLYDAVEYPGHARPEIHPRRLRALGGLLGFDPPPEELARVLELGCGDGMQLLWFAEEFRSARCVGIDLAESALAKGRTAAKAMGLGNVEFVQANLLDMDAAMGEFDYVIAHGLYSWVPDAVRDKLLAICGRSLAPRGIAVVSYNAFPGGHLRRIARDAMRRHAAPHDLPADRVAAAREIIDVLSLATSGDTPYGLVLREELEGLRSRPASALFHDDLAETNDPAYLLDFVAHARRHGLQYLCDATLITGRADFLTPEAAARLEALARDRVEHEQYLDLLRGRHFRHSLLHRAGREPDFEQAPSRAMTMWAAAPLRHAATNDELLGAGEVRFDGDPPQSVTLSHPLLKCALHCVGGAWPRALHAEELLAAAREMANRSAPPEAKDRMLLGTLLYTCAANGIATLSLTTRRGIATPGECPRATAFTRWQAIHGNYVTAPHGTTVDLGDALSRRMLCLLDGSRTLDAVVAALLHDLTAGEIELPSGLQAAHDAGRLREAIAEGVPINLRRFARKGLLEA